MSDRNKDWTLNVWAVGVLLAAMLANGCGPTEPRKKITLTQPPPPAAAPPAPEPTPEPAPTPPAAPCDGAEIATTKEGACPSGETGRVVLVCTASGYKEAVHDCKPNPAPSCAASDTTFAAVQPILARNCVGACHRNHETFAYAKDHAADYLRRITLDVADGAHMPKTGASLTGLEIETFSDWIHDGFCPAPAVPGPGGLVYQSFGETEDGSLRDVTNTDSVDIEDRLVTRWVLATDVIDSGGTPDELERYRQAAEKALNSISTERDMARVTTVAPGVYRFDMDDIGMDADEWRALEAADFVNIESRTQRGELLKLVTGTRKPFVHIETLIEASLHHASLYYRLLDIPRTFDEFTQKIGVDYAGDLRKRDVVMSAFSRSFLSPHNRMVSVHDSRDGKMFCTYDTGPQLGVDERNFFDFPLLADIGGIKNAAFVAGECIYTLPNGLQGYVLFNASQTFKHVIVNGVAQNIFVRSDLDVRADLGNVEVVRDPLSPWSSEIQSGISCFRCHAPGILPIQDEIRAHVIANGAQFGTDLQLIKDVYKVQSRMNEEIGRENDRYLAAVATFGIEGATASTEPVTLAEDSQQLPWSLAKVCGKLWLREGDCQILLAQSATASSQWGQLRNNGSITFDQFKGSLQDVIVELNLFRDDP